MKYLKIENNKGYFQRQKDEQFEWVELDKINKDDLMFMLDQATSSDFEMDVYSEDNMSHKAHQIIYKHIYEKFSTLETMKAKFKDESASFYNDAFEKYSTKEEEK